MPKAKKKTIVRPGDILPPAGTSLHEFPAGCAVKLEGDAQWWLVAFRIGKGPAASVNLRPIPDPFDPLWYKASASGERRFGGVWRVTESAWPVRSAPVERAAIERDTDDPLMPTVKAHA